MKKILSICIFSFALLISSQGFAQSIQAANTNTPKAELKENVSKISNALELTQEQTDVFVKAYASKEMALKENEDKTKVQRKFLASLKGILTEQQIAKLKSLSEIK